MEFNAFNVTTTGAFEVATIELYVPVPAGTVGGGVTFVHPAAWRVDHERVSAPLPEAIDSVKAQTLAYLHDHGFTTTDVNESLLGSITTSVTVEHSEEVEDIMLELWKRVLGAEGHFDLSADEVPVLAGRRSVVAQLDHEVRLAVIHGHDLVPLEQAIMQADLPGELVAPDVPILEESHLGLLYDDMESRTRLVFDHISVGLM